MYQVNILRGKNGHEGTKYLKSLYENRNIDVDVLKSHLRNAFTYDEDKVMILICDYTPVIGGNIQIKYPNQENWQKLRMNSKTVNTIKKKVDFREIHAIDRASWLACMINQLPNTLRM